MNQWIRWKGLIPFTLLTTAVVLFFLFFVDSLAKGLIESTASDMVGARVETTNVDVHLSPLGLRIDGLQVTNPEQPMSNIIEIGQIRFDLATDKLLLGKVIIEQMEMEQVRFDTARTHSGALSQQAPAKSKQKTNSQPATDTTKDKGISMPGLELPDVNEILAREPLETQRQAEAISVAIEKAEQNWKQLQQSLPDQARQDSYQQRFAQLGKTRQDDLRQVALALKELDSLNKDLKADIGRINQARTQVQADLNKLDTDYKGLLRAPATDKQRLLKKYSPDAHGIGNLSGLLFGNQAGEYLHQGLYWYEKLAPMLTGDKEAEPPAAERQQGQQIRFREYQPSPDFLIRRIHTSVATEKGSFEGLIENVTHQPEIIRKPVSFEFRGEKMTGMESLHIHGKFDHINRKQSLDQINMQINGYQVAAHSLSSDPNLRLHITSAQSNTRMHVESRNGQLAGLMNIHMRDLHYDNHAGAAEFQQMLVSAFNQVRDFNIDTDLGGSLKKPRLNIRSDLDKRLNKQISAVYQRRIDEYKQELAQHLQQLTDARIAPVSQSINTMRNQIDTELKATEAKYQQQVDQVEAQKQKLQSRIDAEKRKAESAAKRQLQDKAKALLNKLQGK